MKRQRLGWREGENSGGAAHHVAQYLDGSRKELYIINLKTWKLAWVRQVAGEPETLQGCTGNLWLQNSVGFCEEPDMFNRSHYLIWALDVEAQLSSMWLRNAREYVQHRSEKQVLKTEKSCRLRSVCAGVIQRQVAQGKGQQANVTQMIVFLHGERTATQHFPKA